MYLNNNLIAYRSIKYDIFNNNYNLEIITFYLNSTYRTNLINYLIKL